MEPWSVVTSTGTRARIASRIAVKRFRALEPLPREGAQRLLVARHLHQHRGLGAAVRQHVHEVEDDRRDTRLRQITRETVQHLLAISRVEHLLVAGGDGPAGDALHLRGEELVLEGVQAPLALAIPPPRVLLGDLVRVQSGEDGVARVRGRGREDGAVQRLLHLGDVGEQRQDAAPLVQPQAVDDDEEHRLRTAEERLQEARNQVRREGRAIGCAVDPVAVVAGHVGSRTPGGSRRAASPARRGGRSRRPRAAAAPSPPARSRCPSTRASRAARSGGRSAPGSGW